MNLKRPDLSDVSPAVRAYIEALEAALAAAQSGEEPATQKPTAVAPPEPSEPPTSINLIILSASGLAKRTPRHLYSTQRRGGMGVFDIDLSDEDAPALLALADEDEHLLLFTNQGRAFRLPVRGIPETAVREKGRPLTANLPFRPGEKAAALLPADAGYQVALVTANGWVRPVHKVRLGSSLIPGMSFCDTGQRGEVVAACWSSGSDDLFIATRQGQGIRFGARLVHKNGNLGIRLDADDAVAAITAVAADGGVFLVSAEGKGTVRLMSGFRANKAPGAGGKVAMKTDDLVTAVAVNETDDLFIISQSSKIIRFPAADVPPKTGVVQGVNCMSLRNDRVTAVAVAALS